MVPLGTLRNSYDVKVGGGVVFEFRYFDEGVAEDLLEPAAYMTGDHQRGDHQRVPALDPGNYCLIALLIDIKYSIPVAIRTGEAHVTSSG